MCGRGRPVEGSRDHGLAIDHGELVVQLVAPGEARDAHALCRLLKGLVALFQLAVAIGECHTEQIEHL